MSYEIYCPVLLEAAKRINITLPEIEHIHPDEAREMRLLRIEDLGDDILILLESESGKMFCCYAEGVWHSDEYGGFCEYDWSTPAKEVISVFNLEEWVSLPRGVCNLLYNTYLEIEQEQKENTRQNRIEKLEQDILQMEGEINKLNLKKKELSQYLSIMKNGSS